MEKILVLDFGAQYTQLIARRIREQNVYSEILPPDTSCTDIMKRSPKAIILSGGPCSVYEKSSPGYDRDLFDFVMFSKNNACINLRYYETKGRFLLFILI